MIFAQVNVIGGKKSKVSASKVALVVNFVGLNIESSSQFCHNITEHIFETAKPLLMYLHRVTFA